MKIFYSLVFLCFWFIPGVSIAQGVTLTGIVLDQDGQPVEGVNVTLNNTHLGTSTNDLGLFRLFILSTYPVELISTL